MKRFLFCMAAAVLLTMMAGMMISCAGCGKGAPEAPVEEAVPASADYDGVVQDFTAGVSKVQALHRQAMYSQVAQEYEWRNSKVIFNDTITSENIDALHVTDVTDVFYFWNDGPWVQYITSNVKKGTMILPLIPDVWIEDDDLSDAPIKLNAEDVLQRLKEWNGVLPPAKSITLRLPIGPIRCNAQWVMGDAYDVLFVDAVTGDITDWCPAFPRK